MINFQKKQEYNQNKNFQNDIINQIFNKNKEKSIQNQLSIQENLKISNIQKEIEKKIEVERKKNIKLMGKLLLNNSSKTNFS